MPFLSGEVGVLFLTGEVKKAANLLGRPNLQG